MKIDRLTKPKLKVIIFAEKHQWLTYSDDEITETTIYEVTDPAKLTPVVVRELDQHLEYRLGWQQLANPHKKRRDFVRRSAQADEQCRPSN